MFVDLDSGTILNGPVVEVPNELITEDMTDHDVITAAIEWMASKSVR
jgi:hypothetical protein